MKSVAATVVLATTILVTLLHCTCAPVHATIELDVTGDVRRVIDLGVFGYRAGGRFQLSISHFFVDDPLMALDKNGVFHHNESLGFVLDLVSSAYVARINKNFAREDGVERRVCFIDDVALKPSDPRARFNFLLSGKTPRMLQNYTFKAEIVVPGLYALFFYNCKGFGDTKGPLKPLAVSFSAVGLEYNIESNGRPNYLSVGDQPLPGIFFLFAVVFSVYIFLWVREMRRHSEHVHRMHKVMLLLLVLKTATLYFDSLKYAHYAHTGQRGLWDFFYYVFLIAKGVTLFTVVLLIGSGWSIMKAYLSDQEKKLLMVIVPAQVCANVAMAVIEETSEGNQSWSTAYDVFRILDLFCCCAILLPIAWQMKNLRDASGTDGKAAATLARMRQFRTLYIIVVAYIYCTRILTIFIEGALPYDKAYIAKFLRELCAAVFYAYTGYQFRPMEHNPYLFLQQEDLEELAARQEVDKRGEVGTED